MRNDDAQLCLGRTDSMRKKYLVMCKQNVGANINSHTGVGGTVKRVTDATVGKGKDIDSIDDFHTIVIQSAENIKLEIVNDSQIFEKNKLMPSDKLKLLKGTNKVHQVL